MRLKRRAKYKLAREVQLEVECRIRKGLSQRDSMNKLEQQKAREKKQELAKFGKLEWENQ